MSHYSIRDYGTSLFPWRLNRNGDVLCRHYTPAGISWAVQFVDNTIVSLPPDIRVGIDISDDGVVLGWQGSFNHVLFDAKTATTQPFSIPGFPILRNVAMDYHGNLAGTAAQGELDPAKRGFLWERNTQALTWLYPSNMPLPPGATPHLELSDRNIHGHATGSQGWIKGSEQHYVAIFYDGNAITPIGKYTFSASGGRISNNDRISVYAYSNLTFQEYRAIYDGMTDTLTPFHSGRIIDLNAAGQTLWETLWPAEMADYLTGPAGTQPMNQAFPIGSGWSAISTIRMNDAGMIIGYGLLGKEHHGFMLIPNRTYPAGGIKELAATILWGVINDAGGVVIVGGRPLPVPPRGPLDELLGALPAELRKALSEAIDHARLDDFVGVEEFSTQVKRIVMASRQQAGLGG